MRNFTRVLFCGMALLLVLAGCETNKDKERDDRDADRLARRERRRERDRLRDDDTVIAGRRDRLDDRTSRRSRGMEEIPAGATEVEGGPSAGRLEYEPTRDGVIYVYDQDDDQVIYVARVRDQERFRLDPENDRATINTRTVFRGDLNPRHRYRLYFDRAG